MVTVIARVLGFGAQTTPNRRRYGLVVECRCGTVTLVRPGETRTVNCRHPPRERGSEFGPERQCKRCLDWWLLEQFEYRSGSDGAYGGRMTTCIACVRERKNEERRKHGTLG